jgi:hypothetical protein
VLLLKFKVTWSINHIHSGAMLWRAGIPNWLALSSPLSSMCLWTIFRITFLKNLLAVDKRLIECKFWGNFGSLFSFVNVITFASFQGFGKWDSQWLWWPFWLVLRLLQSQPHVTPITYFILTHLHRLQSLHANIPFYSLTVFITHMTSSHVHTSRVCLLPRTHSSNWLLKNSYRVLTPRIRFLKTELKLLTALLT